jgi:predicted nucleic acid-binding Zn ribbon protein
MRERSVLLASLLAVCYTLGDLDHPARISGANAKMECPNCGTYNPPDREVCWRCDKPLPAPKPEKKRNPQQAARTWLYVAIAVFVIFTLLQMCGVQLPFGTQQPPPEGQLLLQSLGLLI